MWLNDDIVMYSQRKSASDHSNLSKYMIMNTIWNVNLDLLVKLKNKYNIKI